MGQALGLLSMCLWVSLLETFIEPQTDTLYVSFAIYCYPQTHARVKSTSVTFNTYSERWRVLYGVLEHTGIPRKVRSNTDAYAVNQRLSESESRGRTHVDAGKPLRSSRAA
jgi:hypothetical protein